MNFIISSSQQLIKHVEAKQLKVDLPIIDIGDTIKMGLLIQEGNKERIQYAEGVIIAKHNAGINTTITVRKVMQGIGVERVYLVHSPRIKTISIIRKSKVRRAKLYYLRQRSGKATRLKQRFN